VQSGTNDSSRRIMRASTPTHLLAMSSSKSDNYVATTVQGPRFNLVRFQSNDLVFPWTNFSIHGVTNVTVEHHDKGETYTFTQSNGEIVAVDTYREAQS
jgi:hypothetical protein